MLTLLFYSTSSKQCSPTGVKAAMILNKIYEKNQFKSSYSFNQNLIAFYFIIYRSQEGSRSRWCYNINAYSLIVI